jgi:hypothetical protein
MRDFDQPIKHLRKPELFRRRHRNFVLRFLRADTEYMPEVNLLRRHAVQWGPAACWHHVHVADFYNLFSRLQCRGNRNPHSENYSNGHGQYTDQQQRHLHRDY